MSLTLTHEETKEKKYEIELSWITKENDYIHQLVPRELRQEAEAKALAEIENEQMAWSHSMDIINNFLIMTTNNILPSARHLVDYSESKILPELDNKF